ncbi:zinc ribbon domain-containing protein [Haloterrigena sp. SYSU A558-1]|uniref:Zinc ribbon domain-containing protein n=1 Tax=Haloterrigena gelatinilytica TaxID=2741724 RepID=A0A8J8GQM1_9EURY|nr:zinc ribbon domain-containing protein [Haloterrigena gelatinilytica]NUB92679.1 zinc ribbon domain-containing protein [Haloterrigena gelatinilytica]NUC71405.1 zinc ribbon domain-containing protein [Haloterrigena gelatinilytica]
MDPTTVVLGSVLLFAVHLSLAGALRRYLSGSAGIGLDAERTATVDRDAETVVCPDCGAENDLDYRFCRNCVEELPGSAVGTASSAAPSRRGIV